MFILSLLRASLVTCSLLMNQKQSFSDPCNLHVLPIKSFLLYVICFLLGNSTASEFYVPTFQNALSVPSSQAPVKMEGTECSKTLAYQIQTLGNYPEESTRHSECGESLKSRISCFSYSDSA